MEQVILDLQARLDAERQARVVAEAAAVVAEAAGNAERQARVVAEAERQAREIAEAALEAVRGEFGDRPLP